VISRGTEAAGETPAAARAAETRRLPAALKRMSMILEEFNGAFV
jgi:hypothetical protein